jgi:SpoVK/Ycf46/Vps4 family AAA+-type ATPase
LDEAVRRRLVKKLYIPLPNGAGRRQFLQRLIDKELKGNKHMILSQKDIDELVKMTKGYSGADLKNLSVEAAMIPLRSITDIANVDINNIRPTNL